MITIAEYLSYLSNQILQARALADAESARIAAAYSKDEFLKHFPVPRFRIPEIELSVPISISKAELDSDGSDDVLPVSEERLVGIAIKHITQILNLIKAPITDPNDKRYVKVIIETKELFKKIITLSIEEKLKVVESNYDRLLFAAVELSGVLEYDKKSLKELIATSTKQLLSFLQQKTANVTKAQLKKILINPETEVMKNMGTNAPVFFIKAKLIEDAFFLKTINDDKGNERFVVDFE